MASYFLPSAFQKRLLRYALSRLELFDDDTLNLDNLDIAWGKRSSVELREIGLKLKKVASLLRLPRWLELLRARVILLRITVPADIYNSSIIIEIEGVEVKARLPSRIEHEPLDPARSTTGDQHHEGAGAPYAGKASKGPPSFDQLAAESEDRSDPDDTDVDKIAFPTTVDLATSFLEAEPVTERARLEAEIASRYADPRSFPPSSDRDAEDDPSGTGTGLSLPGFLSSFLQGINDRMQAKVKDVQLAVDVDLQNDAAVVSSPATKSDLVTIQLRVKEIDIAKATHVPGQDEALQANFDAPDPSASRKSPVQDKGRQGCIARPIAIRDVRVSVLSDASVFASFLRSSGPPSPSTAHRSVTSVTSDTKLEDKQEETTVPLDKPSSPLMSSPVTDPSVVQTNSSPQSSTPPEDQGSRFLDASVVATEDGRFDNASEEEENATSRSAISPARSLVDDDLLFEVEPESGRSHDLIYDDAEEPAAPASRNSSEVSDLKRPLEAKPKPRDEPRTYRVPASTGSSSPFLADLAELGNESSLQPSIGEASLRILRPASASSQRLESSRSTSLTSRRDANCDGDLVGVEDLSESRIFSHEQAQSMYMSALSGGLFSESRETTEARTEKHDDPSLNTPVEAEKTATISPLSVGMRDNSIPQRDVSASSTFRTPNPANRKQSLNLLQSSFVENEPITDTEPLIAGSTENELGASANNSERLACLAKVVFYVDEVTVLVPASESTQPQLAYQDHAHDGNPHRSAVRSPGPTRATHPTMPGAFSSLAEDTDGAEYFERLPTPPLPSPLLYHKSGSADGPPVLANETLRNLTTVTVGNCVAQLDAPLGRLLLVLAQSLVIQLGAGKQSSPSTASSPQDSSPPWRINIGKITLRLLEQLMGISVTFKERLSPGSMTPPVDDSYQPTSRVEILLQANVTKLELERSAHGAEVGTSVSAGKITLGYAAEDYIISFDASLKMRESIRDVRMVPDQDIFLLVRQSTFLTKINLTTLPIHMNLDLQRLDDTLAWFGGFSSILGLGSSIASIATVTAPAPAPTSSPGQKRAVRFDIPPAESRPPPVSRAQTKMDARIGGVILDVHGKECSVRLDTTAVKTVVRQEVIGAQVDRLKLSGPHTRHEINEASIVFDHTNLRMEYLSVPTEADLGRLLCLLSPSHDNYATDDDILVETLMRQRKQGSVLRISLEKVSGRIEGSSHFSRLATLSGEIAKLSTVAKYLPDDERAGILTLGLVRTVEVEANVHAGLGRLSLQSRNVEICHVGLPFLLATSVQSMRLCRGTEEELLAEVSATELGNTIPMIMARMIGDELEPTLKAKLRGVRVEYRVPIVMALSDMTGATTSEEAFAGLAKSVIGLGDLEQPSVLSRGNQASADERYPPQCKYLQVDIIFRDCILGLNPLGMPCKGLVVLTDTHFTGGLGDSSLMRMTVDVRKSSLLLIDDVGRIPHATSQGPNPRGEPTGTEGDLVADLCTNGFVSIAYISSAKISMRELASPRDGKRSIDLQLNDNVLVLESCADSTQTLLSLFGALAPPRPPSKEIKYRTEVISVRDMLASLSGDAFTPVDRNADSEDDYFMSEDDATLPGELDQSYLSVEDDEPGRRFVSRPLQSLDNLADEQQASSGNELRFEDDYFESKGRGHGGAPKWDSIQNRYGVADDLYILGSPLKIRIRDVHVMWNLFDGYDWPKTRDAISHAVEDVSLKARERQLRQEQAASREDDESAIGDFLFNSIYIGIPANRDPKDLVSRINHDVDDGASEPESTAPSTMSRTPSHQPRAGRGRGKKVRLGRSKHHKMAFEIRGITTDLIVFPPGSGETQSSLDIRVRDFEIYDHVPTSTWKKFLTYMHDAGAREIGSDMVHLEILNVQPIPDLAASEMVLKVTLLPLRLHVDQDALDFLTRFFEFKDDQQPVPASAADVPFLQRVEVSAVRVQLDYKPKKIDYAGLRSGHTTEFMNLFILDQADMVLRHVIIYGVSGFDKLSRTLNDIWMPDIKTTQLPGVLAGLAPVRSIVNVGGGLRGLVVVPLQEYRRDGRLVRGLQKGAVAFARTTTSELVKLGTKVAIRTQTALQGAEEFLNRPGRGGGRGRGSAGFGDPADDYGHDGRDDDDDDDDDNDNEGEAKKTISLYANPPIGVMQGLRGALGSLERDLLTARDAIVAMPGEMLDSGSAHGAAQAVLHRAPTIILRPAIGASKAISQTLMGATHALDPHHQRRVDEKYKRS